MKKLSVVVAGTGQIRDVEIQSGTTAGDVLNQLGLKDYLLSKGPNDPFFAAAESIYDKVNDSKLASVQKLLERLEDKGCVGRDRSERAHRFRALVSREDFLRHRLQGLADRLCDGAIVPLVTTLLRSKKGLSRKHGEQLRRLIDELWPSDQ